MMWCRAIWEKKLPKIHYDSESASSASVAQMASDIAGCGLEWEVVEGLLDRLKSVVAHFDRSWVEG